MREAPDSAGVYADVEVCTGIVLIICNGNEIIHRTVTSECSQGKRLCYTAEPLLLSFHLLIFLLVFTMIRITEAMTSRPKAIAPAIISVRVPHAAALSILPRMK